MSDDKFCIFCGKKPKSKNKEHVIPRWLMDHVGIANDVVRFGFSKTTGSVREFAYKSFSFPACQDCNSYFGSLEEIAKPILVKLLAGDELASVDFHSLLDWFDKVRIGLWLGFYYLDKNIGGIKPNFHIRTRIAAHDRMLHIVKIKQNPRELSFRGSDSIAFHYTPSCFSMIINDYCLYNVSAPFLFSRRLGFPYPSQVYFMEDGLMNVELKPARKKIMQPILLRNFAFAGTGIYQPIYRSVSNTLYSEFYNDEYVKAKSFQDGIGKVFIQKNSKVFEFPDSPSSTWLPTASYARAEMNPAISIDTLEWQLYLHEKQPSARKLPYATRQSLEKERSNARRYARDMIKILLKNAA